MKFNITHMSQDYNNPTFKKLLDRLQEESWQLELLISGFAIFGLFSAYPALEIMYDKAQNESNFQLTMVLVIALAACSILMFNLLLHVLLRGLWIGALGLRYVSGDIDYEALKYSKTFTKYLNRKVGSFDRYIARLENYCSIIFAISFLLIFYVIAFVLIISILGFLIKNSLKDVSGNLLTPWISIPALILVMIGIFLTFFDFISLGLLKKKNWISKIYFPIYWVFSILTLSFLYRPLVYNFLDNKFGKRLSFFLVPIYVILLVVTTLSYKHSNYFNFEESSNPNIANSNNYEDMLIDESDFIDGIAINSKVISNNYIKVFVVFNNRIEDEIYKFNPKLKPKVDNRGLKSDIVVINLEEINNDNLTADYLDTFNSIYSINIDSVDYKTDFVLAKTIKNQKGFETYIGIKNLKDGKHLLNVKRKFIQDKDTLTKVEASIPFWYYPN